MLEEKDAEVSLSELESHLDELAEEEMNGRQIRNAITTARQLAFFRKQRLDWSHLDQVMTTAREFNRYLKGIHGHSDEEWARDEGIR